MCYKRGNYIKYGLQILRISVSVFEGDLACACADIALYIAVWVENKVKFLAFIDTFCGFSYPLHSPS